MAGERAWRVTVDGFPSITTSELTLDEAALVEEVCGVPYTLMNPLASVKVAKGLLVVLLKRSRVNAGLTPELAEQEALKAAGAMTTAVLTGAFEFVPGDRGKHEQQLDRVAGDGVPGPPSLAPTSASG